MSAKEEVREGRAYVVYNGSASRINEIGLHIYPVSEYDSGEGIPYAPVDWPNAGDKWGWRAGKRVTSSGTFRDRYLYLPKNFKAPKAILCDICCIEPGFCRNCCCILCCKTISSDYEGYSYIRCEAKVDGYICGHVSHLDCALRVYMAGTIGVSINLDAQYLCRYCDSRMDLVPHALKLLNTCTSVASHADIEKILNVGIWILRGSQKTSGKELMHRIESIKARV